MRIPYGLRRFDLGLCGITLGMSALVLLLMLIMTWGAYDLLRSSRELHESFVRLDKRLDRLDNTLTNELDRQREEVR